jgi:flavin-dependent dehydrogenase
LAVSIFERESFPRDHIGESQLPAVTQVLDEMGVWDKVEAAGFPIKLGGTYRWGATDELWHLNFVEPSEFADLPRPSKYEGQRRLTAFQVDRSIFDKILLDHAASMGCDVRERTAIKEVRHSNGYITSLVASPDGGEPYEVKAKYYVDASGELGVLRRALEIPVKIPTALRNIAFWDYWQDAEWAETIGHAATRIQVMSLGWGWVWFIPITETRTSIGLVLPADYFKSSGKRPEELYSEAVRAEPLIAELTKNATREGRFSATKDWNFLTERLADQNWLLTGDACGFADPILSAGMTLAHASGRKAAYSILELLRKRYPKEWILAQYSDGHRQQIRHHMMFAEFWYAGNGCFSDLKAYCSEIADSVGLKLNPDAAFAWLGSGGFTVEEPGFARAATFPMSGVKHIASSITGAQTGSPLTGRNVIRKNLDGASLELSAQYREGGIEQVRSLVRGKAKLPLEGLFALIVGNLTDAVEIDELVSRCAITARKHRMLSDGNEAFFGLDLLDALEALIVEGWITAGVDHKKPPSQAAKLDLEFALSIAGSRSPSRDGH